MWLGEHPTIAKPWAEWDQRYLLPHRRLADSVTSTPQQGIVEIRATE
jgi:hypothetical protein